VRILIMLGILDGALNYARILSAGGGTLYVATPACTVTLPAASCYHTFYSASAINVATTSYGMPTCLLPLHHCRRRMVRIVVGSRAIHGRGTTDALQNRRTHFACARLYRAAGTAGHGREHDAQARG